MNKRRKRVLIISLGVLFVFLIPMLINVAYKFDSGIWFLQTEWKSEGALSFYGSVLAAVVTVLGVVLTIQHERDARKKDNSILYKPILELIHVNPQSLPAVCGYREVGLGYAISFHRNDYQEDMGEYFFAQQRQNNPKYVLLFQNVGRGEIFNAVVDEFIVRNINWNDISCIGPNISCNQYIGEIIQNGYFYIRINLPDYLIMPKDLGNQRWFELVTDLKISYSDMFNRIRYQTVLHIKHKIIVLEEASPSPAVDDDTYHYVKVAYEPYEIMPLKMVFSQKNNAFVEQHNFALENDASFHN